MPVDLAGKHALVTGGSRGIGRAIALSLARAGADVIVGYRAPGPAVDSLASQLKETGGNHHLVQADVTVPGDAERLATECEAQLGSLDTVVNNAGTISHIPAEQLSLADWHRVVDTCLTGAFAVIQQSIPLLGAGGSVISIGSRAAHAGIPARCHYTAAKAGLEGMTRSLARELGGRGIRVNVVAPGVIDTREDSPVPPAQWAQIEARYCPLTSLGRLGTAEEVANVVLFLASDLASYVTGQTIFADGGV